MEANSQAKIAVERVNASLSEFFQLNNVRHRSGKKARLHFTLVTLVYNSMKLVLDRVNKQQRAHAT
ncbi:hypothetical protein [Fontibacillus panacisegetis]|uniref:hypothetical protein n=1 Tax=Fontibacillus solani TaxID=1572857 RepID=UPI0015FAD445